MMSEYPQSEIIPADEQVVADMDIVMDVIRAIRNVRGELDVPPGKKIKVVLDCKSEQAVAAIRSGQRYIHSLARVEELELGIGLERPKQASTQVAGEVDVLIPWLG